MDKPSSEWIESDLLALIQNGVEEGIDIEYKRADSLGGFKFQVQRVNDDAAV